MIEVRIKYVEKLSKGATRARSMSLERGFPLTVLRKGIFPMQISIAGSLILGCKRTGHYSPWIEDICMK